jgi:hypothetical protein
MQATPPDNAPTPADPGFKLPEESASPQDAVAPALPRTLPETAHRPVEVMPVEPNALPVSDTSDRDMAIGAAVFAVFLIVFFFVRSAYVHHLVRKRVAPASADNAGWLLYVGLGFLAGAAGLAIINPGHYLNLAVTAPLVVVGLIALGAALFVGRR